jgi:RNA recognition motif-containing protein
MHGPSHLLQPVPTLPAAAVSHVKFFVGDLSFFCTEKDLHVLFSPFGHVQSIHIPRTAAHGESLMHGFVHIEPSSQFTPQQIVDALDGQEYMGRNLCVQVSTHNGQRNPLTKDHLIQVHMSFISKQAVYIVDEKVLRDIFSAFGLVADISIKKHAFMQPQNFQSGYGFVYFFDVPTAQYVVASLKGKRVNDVTIDCSMSFRTDILIQGQERGNGQGAYPHSFHGAGYGRGEAARRYKKKFLAPQAQHHYPSPNFVFESQAAPYNDSFGNRFSSQAMRQSSPVDDRDQFHYHFRPPSHQPARNQFNPNILSQTHGSDHYAYHQVDYQDRTRFTQQRQPLTASHSLYDVKYDDYGIQEAQLREQILAARSPETNWGSRASSAHSRPAPLFVGEENPNYRLFLKEDSVLGAKPQRISPTQQFSDLFTIGKEPTVLRSIEQRNSSESGYTTLGSPEAQTFNFEPPEKLNFAPSLFESLSTSVGEFGDTDFGVGGLSSRTQSNEQSGGIVELLPSDQKSTIEVDNDQTTAAEIENLTSLVLH